jgi:hypothetical protein
VREAFTDTIQNAHRNNVPENAHTTVADGTLYHFPIPHHYHLKIAEGKYDLGSQTDETFHRIIVENSKNSAIAS